MLFICESQQLAIFEHTVSCIRLYQEMPACICLDSAQTDKGCQSARSMTVFSTSTKTKTFQSAPYQKGLFRLQVRPENCRIAACLIVRQVVAHETNGNFEVVVEVSNSIFSDIE